MPEQNESGNLGVTIFLFLLAIVLLIFSIRQQFDSKEKQDQLVKDISEKVTDNISKEVANIVTEENKKSSEFPDYNSLSDLKKLNIISDFESWTPDTKVFDEKVKKVIVIDKGKIGKGYIYIKASVNDKPITLWESLYLKMNNVGGHIFRKSSLPVPQSSKTELLFSLDNVFYLPSVPYSENRTPLKANWFNFFRDNGRVEVWSFISSLKPAKIDEITLYYGCKDNSDCILSIKN